MRVAARIAQPFAWIAFTYAACLVNLRGDSDRDLLVALGLLGVALVVTWRSYRGA